MKFFRADEATYERVRSAIDAANGWPDAGTFTAIEPAATAPRDAAGRVLLAVQPWIATAAAEQIAGLEEITESDYVPNPLQEPAMHEVR
jgi:hypothetical protein